MMNDVDLKFMQHALELAQQAASANEVPVGAVLVLNNEILGSGFNQPIASCDPTAHAEIIALRNAAQHINNYRILNATMYVTLEPCPMCTYAMIHARIAKVIYACPDLKSGALGGAIDLTKAHHWNHALEHQQGPCENECKQVLQEFFQVRRG